MSRGHVHRRTHRGVVTSGSADAAVRGPRFAGLPRSWTGWLSLVVLLLGAVQFFTPRPFGYRGTFGTLVVAGVFALTAIVAQRERSVLVWIALVVGVLAALLFGAELVSPH